MREVREGRLKDKPDKEGWIGHRVEENDDE